jgi:sugar transferase EpsL
MEKINKRLVDLAVTLPCLLFLLPFLLMVALLIRWQIGSPVFFKQQRPGLHGKPFLIYKFRTMTEERNSSGTLLPDVERMTSFGRFLRNTSLDELPELWNVVKGDMSLVGPRPLLMEYLDRYTSEQARRHDLRPGITGWAQVNGRNAISWEQKFAMDVWYVDNSSLLLDIKILLLTAEKTILQKDISEKGGATMSKFMGSKKDV